MTTTTGFEHYHPLYNTRLEDWTLLDDAYAGQSRIKSKTQIYLPATSGQLALGMGDAAVPGATTGLKSVGKPGQLLYDAYLGRALFPDVLRATVQALVGLMVREQWDIKLPDGMSDMMGRATERGESMTALIDRVLENVLLYGRTGLLLDVDEAEDLPYLVAYNALKIINWDDTPVASGTRRKLRMVSLDETRFERSESTLAWNEEKSFRLLTLGEGDTTYTTQVERRGTPLEEITPSIQGRTLDRVPFNFINATDLVPAPGEVPMVGLARLAMAIYRQEADYRTSLFMQGQDTLVLQGVANPGVRDYPDPEAHVTIEDQMRARGSEVVVGAGAIIYLPDPEMDAKFIGVTSTGLSEMRSSLENDYERAAQFGMSLLTSGSGVEAAETLRTRVAARTASLASIAKTSAAGIEQSLKTAAEWMQLNPDDVSVTPNLDFVDDTMAPADLMKLVEAKMRGMRLSWKTIHENARRGNLTNMTFEDETEEIEGEPDLELGGPGVGEEDPSGGSEDGDSGPGNENEGEDE